MNNAFQNLIVGIGCIVISIFLYIFRGYILKNPKNKESLWHFSTKQRKNKINIIIVMLIILSIILISVSIYQFFKM